MKKNSKGAFALVLHAHLPYVLSHGRWPHGTDWLNEAAAETYVPLLSMLNDLAKEGRSPRITVGVTPVLTEQLSHEGLQIEFTAYLKHRLRAAEADQKQFQFTQPDLYRTACFWQAHFETVLSDYNEKYKKDIVGAFRQLQDADQIEIITSGATHGYMPLLSKDASVRAQIKTGVASYKRHYGRAPRGIWLPECAYRPRYAWSSPLDSENHSPEDRAGVEEILAENGIRYFMIDTAMLRGGEPMGTYLARFKMLEELWQQFEDQYTAREEDKTRSPQNIYHVTSGDAMHDPVAVFTRDPETGEQVWSGAIGYPGDPNYLEFHKKQSPGGLRYWRVTGPETDLGHKQPYDRDQIAERIEENAEHFCGLVRKNLMNHYEKHGQPGVVCAPFDAELFGHWWFEGVQWLKCVLTKLADDPDIDLVTCSEYLENFPPRQIITLPEGSWGEGGYHYIWFNQDTEWVWKLIYADEDRMIHLTQLLKNNQDEKLNRMITQAGRELLLLQSSDWPFIISTTHARDYANLRIENHHATFVRLADMSDGYDKTGDLDPDDWQFLLNSETRDALFPDLDVSWFADDNGITG